DDLTTLGTQEPYRMFTSRAEYRLTLREDNADLRLTAIGRQLGLVDDQRWSHFQQKSAAIEAEQNRLRSLLIRSNSQAAEQLLQLTGQKLEREQTALDLLRRPEITHSLLSQIMVGVGEGNFMSSQFDKTVAEQVEIQVKYAGYIERQTAEIERHRRHEDARLPIDLDYQQIPSLSPEVKQKLGQIKPATLGQAARIPGITPAAISILLVYLKKPSP